MAGGEIITRHTFDDAAYLAGLARDISAAKRASQEIQNEMVRAGYSVPKVSSTGGSFWENNWRKATQKTTKMVIGFENIGMAAVAGVGASVAIAAKAFVNFREKTSLANDALAATSHSTDKFWMAVGQSAHLAVSSWDRVISKTVDAGTAFIKWGQKVTLGSATVAAMDAQLAQDQEIRRRAAFNARKRELDLEKETIAGWDQEAARIREVIRTQKELEDLNKQFQEKAISAAQAAVLRDEIYANSAARLKAVQEQRLAAENAEFEKIAELARKAMADEEALNAERAKTAAVAAERQAQALQDIDLQRQYRDLELETLAAKQEEMQIRSPAARRSLEDQHNRELAIRRENLDYMRELQSLQRNDAISDEAKAAAANDLYRQHERSLDLIRKEQREVGRSQAKTSSVPVGFGVSSVAAAAFGNSPASTAQKEQVAHLKNIYKVLERIANKQPTAMSAVYS